eukprot:1119283-Prymnesium_polylepis.1
MGATGAGDATACTSDSTRESDEVAVREAMEWSLAPRAASSMGTSSSWCTSKNLRACRMKESETPRWPLGSEAERSLLVGTDHIASRRSVSSRRRPVGRLASASRAVLAHSCGIVRVRPSKSRQPSWRGVSSGISSTACSSACCTTASSSARHECKKKATAASSTSAAPPSVLVAAPVSRCRPISRTGSSDAAGLAATTMLTALASAASMLCRLSST